MVPRVDHHIMKLPFLWFFFFLFRGGKSGSPSNALTEWQTDRSDRGWGLGERNSTWLLVSFEMRSECLGIPGVHQHLEQETWVFSIITWNPGIPRNRYLGYQVSKGILPWIGFRNDFFSGTSWMNREIEDSWRFSRWCRVIYLHHESCKR